mmetsp:Transcript_12461/g.30289  ORF Transcript_12461/g.30289 Transcript_12461/m.30289 type:complete len:252 (+) Transcript_12461:1712-2467(+)
MEQPDSDFLPSAASRRPPFVLPWRLQFLDLPRQLARMLVPSSSSPALLFPPWTSSIPPSLLLVSSSVHLFHPPFPVFPSCAPPPPPRAYSTPQPSRPSSRASPELYPGRGLGRACGRCAALPRCSPPSPHIALCTSAVPPPSLPARPLPAAPPRFVLLDHPKNCRSRCRRSSGACLRMRGAPSASSSRWRGFPSRVRGERSRSPASPQNDAPSREWRTPFWHSRSRCRPSSPTVAALPLAMLAAQRSNAPR